MHVKNAITVALQILPSFPVIKTHSKELEHAIEAVIKRTGDEEVTQDLALQCKS